MPVTPPNLLGNEAPLTNRTGMNYLKSFSLPTFSKREDRVKMKKHNAQTFDYYVIFFPNLLISTYN